MYKRLCRFPASWEDKCRDKIKKYRCLALMIVHAISSDLLFQLRPSVSFSISFTAPNSVSMGRRRTYSASSLPPGDSRSVVSQQCVPAWRRPWSPGETLQVGNSPGPMRCVCCGWSDVATHWSDVATHWSDVAIDSHFRKVRSTSNRSDRTPQLIKNIREKSEVIRGGH